MLELYVSACLLSNPDRCKDVSLTYMAEGMSLMQCMMGAPVEIAKWNEAHPKEFAKRWTCRPAGQLAKI
jgi:hypothetical protein